MDYNSQMGERVTMLHKESSEVNADVNELISGNEVLHERVGALADSGREMMNVLRTPAVHRLHAHPSRHPRADPGIRFRSNPKAT